MQRCLGCMRAFGEEFDVCPHCGYIVGTGAASKNYLEPGTVLQNRYTLGKVLGQGGFGITYIAWDQRLEIPVAVKEFFPTSFAARMTGSNDISCFDDESRHYFESGMNNVLDESRRLARFTHLENVVRVHNCFEENNTAYIVMELLRGETVQDILRRDGKMTLEQSMGIMMPILQALEEIHRTGLVHRDISPDNIFVCEGGQAKLLDFGAARIVNGYDQKTLSIILKKGFAPIEQYKSHGTQGTFTDVYAVCATLYKMLTGVTPEDSLSRSMQDSLRPISDMVSIPKSIERILQKGMAVQVSDRIQTAGELYTRLRQALQDEQMRANAQQEKKNKREHRIPFNGKRLRILIAAVAATLLLAVVAVAVVHTSKKPTPPAEPGETETANSTHIETETTDVLPVVTEKEDKETLRQALDDKETTDLDYAESQETANRKSEIYSAYKKALMNLRKDCVLPTGEKIGDNYSIFTGGEEESTFCIEDVDMDGVEELVIYWTETICIEVVYQYDAATSTMKEELRGYPGMTFYDNGVMQEPLSHNQGRGQKNWPYRIFEYNAASDSYEEKGMVDSWDKEYSSEDYPQDVDTSNYGTVFSIQYEGYGETYEDYFSKEVYDEFLNKLLKDAKEIKLDFIPLSFENIDRIAV